MRALYRQIETAAETDVTVLISGETGTGKELIARELHAASNRAHRPLVTVDCGSIPEPLIEAELFGATKGAFTNATEDRKGAFEEANGGTVFLDEIGELDLAMQPRLLRVLERGEIKRLGENEHRNIDVRVVAATNRDLRREVNRRRFRADLYYRLGVMNIASPPLRERLSDIRVLAEALLNDVARKLDVTPVSLGPSEIRELESRNWPGNVRELKNVLTRFLLTGVLDVEAPLPESESGSLAIEPAEANLALVDTPFKEAKAKHVAEFERAYIEAALTAAEGQVSKAASRSELDRVYFYRLIKKYGLKK